MKKIISSAILLFVLIINTNAQGGMDKSRKLSFTVGPQISLAAVDLAKTHSWGVGINAQLSRPISSRTSLTGRLNYTHMFGKKQETYVYDGGGSYGNGERNDGMNGVDIMGGIRREFNNNWFGGLDAGLCMEFSEHGSHAAGGFSTEFGYAFGGENSLWQALAAFFGLCGDPKVQIGLRYYIRL